MHFVACMIDMRGYVHRHMLEQWLHSNCTATAPAVGTATATATAHCWQHDCTVPRASDLDDYQNTDCGLPALVIMYGYQNTDGGRPALIRNVGGPVATRS